MKWPSYGAILLSGLGFTAGLARAEGQAACPPTIGVPFGTHYQPSTRQRSTLGKDLVVEGSVRSAKDCRPLRQARVEHWQAGRDGQYHERLRAYQITDDRGHFRFGTEWPGYPPPHIHFRVDAPDHGTLVAVWKQREGEPPVRRIRMDFVLETR